MRKKKIILITVVVIIITIFIVFKLFFTCNVNTMNEKSTNNNGQIRTTKNKNSLDSDIDKYYNVILDKRNLEEAENLSRKIGITDCMDAYDIVIKMDKYFSENFKEVQNQNDNEKEERLLSLKFFLKGSKEKGLKAHEGDCTEFTIAKASILFVNGYNFIIIRRNGIKNKVGHIFLAIIDKTKNSSLKIKDIHFKPFEVLPYNKKTSKNNPFERCELPDNKVTPYYVVYKEHNFSN